MARGLRSILVPGLLLAGVLATGGTYALQIEGLNPNQPLLAAPATAAASGGSLEIRLAGGTTLVIRDWPAFLPQRLGRQQVDASRRLRPAGPTDQLSLTRAGTSRPWLVLGNGVRRGATLIGTWQLRLDGRVWSIADGTAEKALGIDVRQAAPVQVTVENQRWCIYLLQARLPQARPGVVAEDEPQIAWVGWRLDGGKKHCPPAR